MRILLEEAFATRTTDEMLAAFRAASVPCAPINSYSDALVDAQIAHMGLVQQITLPNGVTTKTLGSPVRIDGAFLPITRDPPGLGAHNEEIARSVESIADSAA